jgi:hypothetical protein
MTSLALRSARLFFARHPRRAERLCQQGAGQQQQADPGGGLMQEAHGAVVYMMRPRSRVVAFFGEEGVQFFYVAFGATCLAGGLLLLLAGIV